MAEKAPSPSHTRNGRRRSRLLQRCVAHDGLAVPDRRTAEHKLSQQVAERLGELCGGHPTVLQAELIARAVQIRIRLAIIDLRFLDSRELDEQDARIYATLCDVYGRTIARLSATIPPKPPKPVPPEPPAPATPSLSDFLAAQDAVSTP